VSNPTPVDPQDKLQQDITSTREQLADTVEALAYKVNVPARAKDSVRDTVQTVQVKASELTDDATALANRAVASLPPQARSRVDQFIATVRQRPVPAALVATGTLLIIVRLFRRNR
jgi:chemotaxis regulatin CheY-phosphate phosphatase CheZ